MTTATETIGKLEERISNIIDRQEEILVSCGEIVSGCRDIEKNLNNHHLRLTLLENSNKESNWKINKICDLIVKAVFALAMSFLMYKMGIK